MTVYDDGLPAEGGDAVFISLQVMAVHGFTPLSQTVDIQDADEVIQVVMSRDLQGFILRAFGHFAVPQQNIGGIGQLVQILGIEGHADADGKPLAQRPGGGFGIGKDHGGVAFQGAAEFSVGLDELLPAQLTGSHPQGIEERRGMSFGKNETVIIGVTGIAGIIPKKSD